MTTSEEMTFEKLHMGIEHDCISFSGVCENTSDVFVRLVWNVPPSEDDFRSYEEEGKIRNGDGHQNVCNHRGVSMNKVDTNNEERVKRAFTALVKNKRRLPPVWCKFRIGLNAGKVWYKPSTTPDTGDSHHNLMKCDQFSIDKIHVLDLASLR